MKKLLILAFSAFTLHLYGQLDMRATIASAGLTAEIFVKADSPVNFPNSNNVVAANFAVSIPAAGETNPSNAPTASATSLIAGTAITVIPVEVINDRFVYTFLITGNTPMASAWAADSEHEVLNVTFSAAASGDFPRLDNHLNSGGGAGQGYFYFQLNGEQRSDTEGDPFYGGTEGAYGNGDLYVQASSPLPVTLSYFGASKYQERHSLIKWATTSEIYTSHFEIERSFDGIAWKKVGEVDAAVYSSELKSYTFVDENVFNGRSKSLTAFYRLRMMDLDDHYKYSPIESVLFTSDLVNTTPFLAYPNPAREGVTIAWDANALGQPTTIELYDVAGKLIHVQEVAPNSNQEYIDFVSARASTGMCMVRLMAGTEILDVKQIIIGQN